MPDKKKSYKGKVRGVKSKAPDDKVLLKKFKMQTRPELAVEYGVSEGTIGVWLRNARQRLGVTR